MSSPIDVDVRRITPEGLVSWLETMSTAFLARPDVGRIAENLGPYYDFERTWGAFDGRVVGTLRSWATEITVPGGALVPASAVAGVTVLPSHRRRGLLRRMIAAEHEAARARGEAQLVIGSLLGVPPDRVVRTMVSVGYPTAAAMAFTTAP